MKTACVGDTMIRAKGIFWLNLKKQITEQGGPQALADTLAGLSPEDQAIFAQSITAVSWVDYGAIMRLILHYHKGSVAALKEGSVWAAHENLKGVYRTFISMTSPRFICKNIPLLWKQYFDSGKLALDWVNTNHVVLRISGVVGMPKHHEDNFLPFLEEALRIAGAKDVYGFHSKCLARGDSHCRIELRWK